MVRVFLLLLVLFQIIYPADLAQSESPFQTSAKSVQVAQESSSYSTLLTKIASYQQHLKQKMAGLIRQLNSSGNIYSLLLVLLIGFGYGVVHAAGPGHGKAVAITYIMSRDPSLFTGVLFGTLIAFFHGFSGAFSIVGLHYILQKSITGTLATVSHITQLVSFSLITFLGLGILIKNGWLMFRKNTPSNNASDKTQKGMLPWSIVVGLVPCPGVVMVMLFCISMDAMILGLVLAACISLGMALTISLVVAVGIIGKAGILSVTSKEHARTIEIFVGICSGIFISLLGVLFLLSSFHSAVL